MRETLSERTNRRLEEIKQREPKKKLKKLLKETLNLYLSTLDDEEAGVYVFTYLDDGRRYIGQTPDLKYTLKYYLDSYDMFIFEVLNKAETQKKLDEVQNYYIQEFKTYDSNFGITIDDPFAKST